MVSQLTLIRVNFYILAHKKTLWLPDEAKNFIKNGLTNDGVLRKNIQGIKV